MPLVREIVEYNTALWNRLLSFPALLADPPLIIKDPTQSLLIELFEEKGLSILIAHLLNIALDRAVLGIKKN